MLFYSLKIIWSLLSTGVCFFAIIKSNHKSFVKHPIELQNSRQPFPKKTSTYPKYLISLCYANIHTFNGNIFSNWKGFKNVVNRVIQCKGVISKQFELEFFKYWNSLRHPKKYVVLYQKDLWSLSEPLKMMLLILRMRSNIESVNNISVVQGVPVKSCILNIFKSMHFWL